MFGWLKKRQENELIKLVHQNFLAFSFLTAEQEAAEAEGLQISTRFSEKLEVSRQLSVRFSETKSLSLDEQKAALDLNREARGIYEQLRKDHNNALKTRAPWAKASQAPTFDTIFQPVLGWDDYITEWKSED